MIALTDFNVIPYKSAKSLIRY